AVRAARGLVDDFRCPDQPPARAVGALSDGHRRRAGVRARVAAHPSRRALPRAGGAVIDGGPDPRKFAELLCDWCLEVAPGQQVLINSTTLAHPLLTELHAAVLDRDAWPHVRAARPSLAAGFYRHARERHLDSFAPLDLTETESVDALLGIDA